VTARRCNRCEFGGKRKCGTWCILAREFVAKMGGFCPKETSLKKIRESCANYIPPEMMGDKASCCTAHLDSARAYEKEGATLERSGFPV